MESQLASGLVVAQRALRPPGDADVSAGVEVVAAAPASGGGPPPMRPQRWAGWPTEWPDPVWSNWWGRVETLTDTAWMCLDRNASVIATMPPYLVGAAPSLNADWLNNPDPDVYTSWFEFAKQLLWDFQLGEVFVMPTAWYESGWPSRFHVVSPWLVQVDLDRDGLRRFHIGSRDVTDDILAIRYQSRSDDPRGHGPLEAGRGRIVAANALARYATDLAASGGLPYAVLIHPEGLSAEQSEALQWQWVTNRIASMGLPGVLSGGIDLKVLSFNPEEMGMLDLARFNEARIAYLLGVPAPLVGLPSGQDSMHYDNQTMAREDHWQSGLKPKVDPVMQALSGWALPRGTTIELNRDAYTRPALDARATAYKVLIETGVLSVAEVRELERFGVTSPSESLTEGVMR